MMRTVIFIATRPIESGSELLVDYRLKESAECPLPNWYPRHDVLKIEDEQMPKKHDLVDKYLG